MRRELLESAVAGNGPAAYRGVVTLYGRRRPDENKSTTALLLTAR